jgi:hypothetical protein
MPYAYRTRFRIGRTVHPGSGTGLDGFLTRRAGAVLSQFPQIRGLTPAAKEELIAGVVEAIQFLQVGLTPRRPESSGAGLKKRVFVSDVEFALRRARLPAGNGRDGLLHEAIRALADAFELELPQDLIRIVRSSRRLKRDGARHCTAYRT